MNNYIFYYVANRLYIIQVVDTIPQSESAGIDNRNLDCGAGFNGIADHQRYLTAAYSLLMTFA
jgi:hypothetical protein